MKPFNFILVFLFFTSSYLSGQDKLKPKDSNFYLDQIKNAQELAYEDILEIYRQYLLLNPMDLDIRIDECEFIDNALFDGDYNPKQEDFDSCLAKLILDFPDSTKAALYKLRYLYGDESISFCDSIKRTNNYLENWDDKSKSEIHYELAYQNSYNDEHRATIRHADLAEALDDSLDLSYLKAEQYYALDRNDQAREALLSSIDSLDTSYESLNKAELLVKLGLTKDALNAYDFAMRDSTLWFDKLTLSEVYAENGRTEEARKLIVEEFDGSNSNLETAIALFNHDFKYSPKDSLYSSYQTLTKEGFWADPYGIYRAKMLVKSPFRGWQLSDFLKILMILLTGICFLIVPYIWILPIDFISKRYPHIQGKLTDFPKWQLKDFWKISSLFILVYFLTLILFNYKDFVLYYVNDLYNSEYPNLDLSLAREFVYSTLAFCLAVIFVLKKRDYLHLKSKNWTLGRSIAVGIGMSFLLRVVYFSFVKAGILPSAGYAFGSLTTDSIASVNKFYHPLVGFILVVILVPFYEEYIFRGIILGSVQRKLNFWIANCFQAVLFAALHEDLNLFIFYFLFGLLAGNLVRQSLSFQSAIAFHATNNCIAYIAISNMM